MFPLHLNLISCSSFEGPGLFRFDFKECEFDSKFYSFDNSKRSIERVLQGLKNSELLSRGAYKWYDNNFGPLIIKNITPEDFIQIDSLKLESILNKLIEDTKEKYYDLNYKNGETEIVKRKVNNIIEFIPVDKVLFFMYNVEINKTNIGSTKVEEHNIFDYFYFIFGYNETNFYMLTLFFE